MVWLVLIITNGAKMRLVQRESNKLLEQTENIWKIMNICTDLYATTPVAATINIL